MQNKQKLLSTMALMACCGAGTQAQAALPENAILKFDPFVLGGYYGDVVVSGSYFGMDTNGDSVISKNERVGLIANTGLTLGKTQPATGSHSGTPDGTETPGVDQPWGFFGNTGLHLTSSAPAILTDDGAGGVTIDLSGWVVTWNGIVAIPLGFNAWNGNTDGVADMTCDIDCADGGPSGADGDRFVLNYSATVPAGDPSGFGNVQYALHLEGAVTIPPEFVVETGTKGPGSIAVFVGSSDGRISMDDLLNNGGVADPGFTYGSGLIDFVVTGITPGTVAVVIPQTAAIPANSVYRKFINGGWTTFTADGTNLVASTSAIAGVCPGVNDTAYDHPDGLVEGDTCVQLVIADDGPYDADLSATNIADPGGVATPVQTQLDTRTSGTDGCSISGSSGNAKEHADWWLVAAFIGLLGWFNLKRERCTHKA